MTPFNCPPGSTSPDGPNTNWIQQNPGQKQIFYLDAPGPTTHVRNSDACDSSGGAPVTSMIWWANFKVTFTNTISNNSRTIYFGIKLIVNQNRQLDTTNSMGKYGSF
jgi:hypothetical protein